MYETNYLIKVIKFVKYLCQLGGCVYRVGK
jgi:hypothetical protein